MDLEESHYSRNPEATHTKRASREEDKEARLAPPIGLRVIPSASKRRCIEHCSGCQLQSRSQPLIALDYGHSKCRDSDTSEGLTGKSTRIAVSSSNTALALFLGLLVRPTVERTHPGTNPPLLPANLQSTLRAVGSHSTILISARSH
ncbi:hypothetical protein DAPPUDRAFT_267120 [Daphnia pulex]|uniref:Uncharacterized protein n=1 Tax=Daphnia pulex TaxID=6669 RepID=E9HW10_DAPPU|nr:hypothetical protein DAPPUDRAFT_267120 [Daphnia pulex]|eukprot:EFX64066.1 hypothetical protein DAPPUDRAFT_267120 [Daphnia pulex]